MQRACLKLRKPKPSDKAAHFCPLAQIGILVFRSASRGSLVAGLEQIGKAQIDIVIPRANAEEPVRSRGELSLQRVLQIRTHPVGKLAPRYRQVLEKYRGKVSSERLVERIFTHEHGKNREKPATDNRRPASIDGQPPSPCSNHSTLADRDQGLADPSRSGAISDHVAVGKCSAPAACARRPGPARPARGGAGQPTAHAASFAISITSFGSSI